MVERRQGPAYVKAKETAASVDAGAEARRKSRMRLALDRFQMPKIRGPK